MPTPLTSSFASAAAAAAAGSGENGANRRDGSTGGDWSKTRPNGATQTFRRTSQVVTQSRDNSQPAPPPPSSGPYIPPHMTQGASQLRNGANCDGRYNKEQLLAIYQMQKEAGLLDRNILDLFHGSWDPLSRTVASQARFEGKEQTIGPDVCWSSESDGQPFGLAEMTEHERQFASSVNSPLKLNQAKDPGGNTGSTRKTSISNHHTSAYGSTAGSVSRPSARRRETSDSAAGGSLSPSDSKSFSRTDPSTATPPYSLIRRRTDHKDDDNKTEAKDVGPKGESDGEPQASFGSLRHLATGPHSAGANGSLHSPWSTNAPRSAFESMGNFGNFAVGNSPAASDAEKRPGFGNARSSSRFKDLLTKSSSEDMSHVVKEKVSTPALEKLPEEVVPGEGSRLQDLFKTRPNRSETNPYAEHIPRGGSAALSHENYGSDQLGFADLAPIEHVQATPQGRRNFDALSPANTNPYSSPAPNRMEADDNGDVQNHYTGLPSFSSGGRRDMFAGAADRNPNTFAAPRQGLGNIPGWNTSGFGASTPNRERTAVSSAFGDPIFSPITDIQSPGVGSLGGGFFANGGFGSATRSNRLGALFPPAMQDQMRLENRSDAFDSPIDQVNNRDPFASGTRRQDGLRSLFEEDTSRGSDSHFNAQPGGSAGSVSHHVAISQEHSTGHGPSPSGGSSSSSTLPATQQRQMVMPDRMRWIYRDPQGNVQGPWSGLEMHDWFKAGFFTAELQVKKLEDAEYEPLAQLVRRIGNSREPFLVPQIGVPHGPASSNPSNHWATAIGPSGTQPPFANSFPSFGTTLTAEQQNALERRKQEEQYLMARQKEHLAQQQMYMKQMHISNSVGNSHGLQHHASAHSLQSQPSFSSMTSPGGFQQAPQAPIQPPQSIQGLASANMYPAHQSRDEELPSAIERLNFAQRINVPFNVGNSLQRSSNEQQSELRLHEEAFLGRDGRNERLDEFNDLRRQTEAEKQQEGPLQQPIGAHRPAEELSAQRKPLTASKYPVTTSHQQNESESLSLTQQVQRAAAAQEKIIEAPPVSSSPLPAPTPNRNRQHVADQLAAESRSQSQTPVEPASLAPWAQAEMPKGPSLKEIQEVEAKEAAEQEKLLAIVRLAQAEQERMAASSASAPTPGLPATSNWAASASPTSPAPSSNVWGAKPAPKSAAVAVVATKKTLAQIQKEEEARKQRIAAQTAAQTQTALAGSAGAVAGKRYAELASKPSPAPSQTGSSPWTTVGASGKVKAPSTIVAAPQVNRTVSATSTQIAAKSRPSLLTSRTLPAVNNKTKADDEFLKWARSQLDEKLNPGIDVDIFISNLLAIPAEREIIREAIYGASKVLNGDRLSEEWLRRRKLADKGIFEPAADLNSPIVGDNKNSGWSEVAKKGPVKDESPAAAAAAFRVVAKKKGRK